MINGTLAERLIGGAENDGKIPIEGFICTLKEVERGIKTLADIQTVFDMAPEAVSELSWLANKYQNSTNKDDFINELRDALMQAELGYFGLDDKTALVARINLI